MNWFMHLMGLDNGSGRWYLFWSGFGANFQEYAMLGAALVLYRKHTCHVQGCARLGRFHAGDWVVCKHHSPSGAPTAGDVLDASPSTQPTTSAE